MLFAAETKPKAMDILVHFRRLFQEPKSVNLQCPAVGCGYVAESNALLVTHLVCKCMPVDMKYINHRNLTAFLVVREVHGLLKATPDPDFGPMDLMDPMQNDSIQE